MAGGIDYHLYCYGFIKGELTKSKWIINKKIKAFRNLKDVNFEFIRGGITIIVGENNTGKTNLLNYIYEENENWDKFDEKNYKRETSKSSEKGWLLSYRHSREILFPFFPPYLINKEEFPYIYHKSYSLEGKPKEGQIILSYKIYYFDLTASASFLTEKKDLILNKVKSRNYRLLYGKYEEKEGIGNSLGNYYMIESKENSEEKFQPWIPRFDNRDNFIKHQAKEEIVYYGLNQNVSHTLDKLGSGYLKIETIKSLIEDLKSEKQEPEKDDSGWYKYDQRLAFPEFVHTPILLMDEPEVFLHPSLISGLSSSIKGTEGKGITTILTTHSPAFLLNFADFFVNDEESETKSRLVIIQKDRKNNLKPLLYFHKIIKEIKERVKENYKDFAKNHEDINSNSFYIDKWKTLFNQETLRIFFSKKVLFVEGMTEYLFFNNILRRELQEELKDVEIIPIFGKYHYIYFYELVKELNLNYWFLLDTDLDSYEDKYLEENDKDSRKNKSKRFWKKYGLNKTEKERNGIIHGIRAVIDIQEIISSSTVEKAQKNAIEQINIGKCPEEFREKWKKSIEKLATKEKIVRFMKEIKEEFDTKTTWIHFDLEVFLFGKKAESNKEYNLISQKSKILDNLKENNSAKLEELKKIFNFLDWK